MKKIGIYSKILNSAYDVWDKIKIILIAIINSALINFLPEDLKTMIIVIVNSLIAIVDAIIKYIKNRKNK